MRRAISSKSDSDAIIERVTDKLDSIFASTKLEVTTADIELKSLPYDSEGYPIVYTIQFRTNLLEDSSRQMLNDLVCDLIGEETQNQLSGLV